MEILPGVGVGKIRFGMLEADALEAIGPASKTFEEEGVRHLLYNEMQLDLWFDTEEHNQLEWISCSHPDLTFQGKKIMGMATEAVVELVKSGLTEQDVEHDDYQSFESYTLKEDWIELQCTYGALTSVNFGNRFDENEDPIWP